MSYQSKTTLVEISVGVENETTYRSLFERFDVARAVAVQIASRCQMDIMSFSPYSLGTTPLGDGKWGECLVAVVYVNNGRSLDEILTLMRPERNNKSGKYWMILDLSEWEGSLECQVTTEA